jgi:hypothetical protein
MVVFSILVATETREREEEIMDVQDLSAPIAPETQHFDNLVGEDVGCWSNLGIGAATGGAQIQQVEGHDGEQGDRRLQPSFGGELQRLDSATGF